MTGASKIQDELHDLYHAPSGIVCHHCITSMPNLNF